MKKFFILMLAILALTGCNMPVSPTQPTFPVANLTMTALFSTPLPTIVMTRAPTTSASATQPPLPSLTPTQPAITVPPTAPAPSDTPQPTQAPSATPQPPTRTPPPPTATLDTSRRPGPSIQAGYMASKPVIDGDWNDLPDKEYAAQNLVFGASNWKNADDLMVSYKIGWDANFLYLGVKVRDDIYAQNAQGANLFKGDSIEVLLDANVPADFFVQADSADDFQLGISPGRGGVDGDKEAYLWLPAASAGARSSVKIASKRSDADGITRYEAAIPWSLFGVTPKAGLHLGFALSASDNDSTTSNVQQTMISSAKERSFADPTTWGDLTLVK